MIHTHWAGLTLSGFGLLMWLCVLQTRDEVVPEHIANTSAQAWLCQCAERADVKTYSLQYLLLTLKKCLFLHCSNIFHCWIAYQRARRDFICSIRKILVCLTLCSKKQQLWEGLMMRGFSGLKGNFWSKHIKFVDFWGWWNAGGSFLPSNCLFWTSSVWSSFTVHKHAFLGIEHSSCLPAPFRSRACMLSARLSLTASPPGNREKQSQGTKQKQSKGMWVVGPSLLITGPDVLAWCESCLRLCNSSAWKDSYFIIPISVFNHLNNFFYSRQPCVLFMLHAFRLSVQGHNRTKTKAMRRGWCAWKRMISIYTSFSWV